MFINLLAGGRTIMKRYQAQLLAFLAVGLSWGTGLSPAAGIEFGPEEFVQANSVDIQVPGYSVPSSEDWNGDGLKDLIIGEGGGTITGKIRVYLNVGVDSLPMFSGYSLPTSAGTPIDLPGSLRTRPFACRWTGGSNLTPKDTRWDLLVGYGDGKVRLYRGTRKAGDLDGDGDMDGDDFTIVAKALDKPVPPEGSPADLNHDGVVDVVDLRLFVDLWLAEHK
jgi:hypothetical protein